jgi:cytochrome c
MQRPPRTFLPLTASLLALLMLGSAALAQDPARRGRAILKEFCAGCHAIGKTDKSRREGALPLRELGRSYDLDKFPRVLERGISSSHPAMPEFKFKGRDARAVSAYLRSIQK